MEKHGLLVRHATCLVGLHPDECTEDIIDVALQLNKPMAVVPCCVFPTLFPGRRLRRLGSTDDHYISQNVQTYDDFIEYLLQKDSRLQMETLSFEGKNQVIFLQVPVI